MPMPEQFKYDVRVRERLMRKGIIAEAEIERHLESLPDASANATEIELKQPALQTEAERAENSVIVRPAPPRPVQIAAPISLDDEDDEPEEEEPRKPAKPASIAAPAPAAAAPVAAEPAKAEAEAAAEDADDDEEDEDDEDDDEDEDAADGEEPEEGGVGE